MASLDKPDSQLTAVKWRFPSVHPEGRKFTLIAACHRAGRLLRCCPTSFGWLLVLVTIWVATFFRDPIRTTPQDPALIVAPADGLVTMISRVAAAARTGGRGRPHRRIHPRVDFHERVRRPHQSHPDRRARSRAIAYVPGKFLNADLDKASEDNERQHFLVEREDGVKIGFTQIAGLVARRIMAFVKEGDQVAAGERIGLIRFGSRVDVFLPAGHRRAGPARPAHHRRRNRARRSSASDPQRPGISQ